MRHTLLTATFLIFSPLYTASAQQCTVKGPALPEVRGLRLSQPTEDVMRRFPGLQTGRGRYGSERLSLVFGRLGQDKGVLPMLEGL